jgi:thioredoxin reductase (NADPH)
MARWEPEVKNYLGFPDGIDGSDLLRRGHDQARRHHVRFRRDKIQQAQTDGNGFYLTGEKCNYHCRRLLLATGIFHIPPDIPGIKPCLGHSLFFCKDCDGYRVRGRNVAVYGWSNQAVDYALGMLLYSPCVVLFTDGRPPAWDAFHAAWIEEYQIPCYQQNVTHVRHRGGHIRAVELSDGIQVAVQALFTTRGDLYFNELARQLGAKVDEQGQIIVDLDMRATVPGLYAAGCVTPANCQMIIAAGQGAAAAQAINRDLFEDSLASHSLRRFRTRQLRQKKTQPEARLKVEVPS